MKDFYVRVPDDKAEFFSELVKNLKLEYEQLTPNNNEDVIIDNQDSEFYVDSDD